MIIIVAAISKNNCIGRDNAIPWNLPEDMKRVREITKNKILIMGRRTWESIPEHRRPLPDRVNVVITKNQAYPLPPDVECYNSVPQALKAHPNEDIIGFGGQRIFEEMIKIADKLEITHVNETTNNCQAFFPTIDPAIWQETKRADHKNFSFVTYDKRT